MLKQCSVPSLIRVNTSQLTNESDSHKTSQLYLFDLKRPLMELRRALRSNVGEEFLLLHFAACTMWRSSKNT